MRRAVCLLLLVAPLAGADDPAPPILLAKPDAFRTLINPQCSHCVDEAKRRATELKRDDPVLCWTRGYSEGGAIPIRFFLAPYRVISDSYGVFVYDPDAGYARGFAPSYNFRFHGWRNGVMVMKDITDGTLYSCLSGVAFDGPKKGQRLKPVPTLTTTWGPWLHAYPHAVAYHMFDKYRPIELPKQANADAAKSRRAKMDPRLKSDELVLGVRVGGAAKAYPLSRLPVPDVYHDTISGEKVVVFHKIGTFDTTTAFKPVAHQPRKFKGPNPNKNGVSPPGAGQLLPNEKEQPPRSVTLTLDRHGYAVDRETETLWDPAGRGTSGKLKGWTLESVDAVRCKWFAWSAEYPRTAIYKEKPKPDDAAREIAGMAEFLRLLPKPFATLKAVDGKARTVVLLFDGDKVAKVWPIEPDAEIKVNGWWGRLEQFHSGDRVWVWLKLDRKKQPVSVVMLADAVSEFDMHASLRTKKEESPKFTLEQVDAKRAEQKAWLRKRWTVDGLPGTLTFQHVFSGELELMLDHEAMRWGRSLKPGDVVHLSAEPPIKAVVKSVAPWRERTLARLVVGELESSELKIGQRLNLKMLPPPESVDVSSYPPDIGRPRSTAERVEWFLASIYCTCGVRPNICTGHFYTLASCNPNGCANPAATRAEIRELIGKGLTDQQIWDALRKNRGPLMTKPHLKP